MRSACLANADLGSGRREARETSFLQIADRRHDLLAGVHHERTVARNRLVDRRAGQDEERRIGRSIEPHVRSRAIELHDCRSRRILRPVDLDASAQ